MCYVRRTRTGTSLRSLQAVFQSLSRYLRPIEVIPRRIAPASVLALPASSDKLTARRLISDGGVPYVRALCLTSNVRGGGS
jgi:hypothetical protein